MKQKKIPIRMCIGCNEGKPKKELIRIVKNKEGEIFVDFTSKKPGRGAYVCKDVKCLKQAQKKKSLERAFECKIGDEIYARLENELSGGDEE